MKAINGGPRSSPGLFRRNSSANNLLNVASAGAMGADNGGGGGGISPTPAVLSSAASTPRRGSVVGTVAAQLRKTYSGPVPGSAFAARAAANAHTRSNTVRERGPGRPPKRRFSSAPNEDSGRGTSGDDDDDDGGSSSDSSSDSDGDGGADSRRRSVLMDSSLKSFQRMLDSAGEFMRDEIEKLPLNKYE